MKTAGHKTSFVRDDSEKLVGIFLAADFTSEHEWGIERLKKSFNISRELAQFGIEYRRATAIEGENIAFERRKSKGEVVSFLLGGNGYLVHSFSEQCESPKKPLKDFRKRWMQCHLKEDEISAAWDDNNFIVYAPTTKLSESLKEIYEGFLAGNGLIMMGGGNSNPFDHGGLAIGLINRIPEVVKQEMAEADEDAFKLQEAAKATGIYDLIPKSAYYALSPAWCGPTYSRIHHRNPDGEGHREEVTTKYKVNFWLNPTDQNKNTHGWFTVEELVAWIKGEAEDGPIANRGESYQKEMRIQRILEGNTRYFLFSDEVFCTPCKKITNTGRNYYGVTRGKRCEGCGDTDNLVLPKEHSYN